VIVPSYSRPARLASCLRALGSLDYPPELYEIIVVDDGSEAPHEVTMKELCREAGVPLLRQANAGPAAARNAGAALARGSYLAFVDDDCEPARDWLTKLARHVDSTPDAAIGGHTVNRILDNPYSAASQALIDYLYFYYGDDGGTRRRFFTSNNFAVSKDAFRAVGGFDETFPFAAGEDREFCDRWIDHGHALVYAADAIVYHSHVMTFHGFCRQHFNYGRGALRFHRARARRGVGGVRLEPIRFYTDLLAWPFAGRTRTGGAVLSALMIVTQVANAAGFFYEAALQAGGRPAARGQRAAQRPDAEKD
jgi:GT2 family glycosyltransferase